MNREFAPYEPSLNLKELGFNEPCFAWYDGRYPSSINQDYCKNSEEWLNTIHCATPTFSQAFRFFREKYDLFGVVEGKGYDYKRYYVYSINGKWHPSRPGLDTYEEAELACLIKLIEIVKNNE
jgi:hypothetical protein